MDCSPPVSSVRGILQARTLEWVAISFSRGSSRPRDRTQVSHIAGIPLSHQGSHDSPSESFPRGSVVKNPPVMWETRILSLSREDPLEKGTTTRSSVLAWRIPWTKKP